MYLPAVPASPEKTIMSPMLGCVIGHIVDRKIFGFTLFTLKMAPVEDQNVHRMFSTCSLTVIFKIKSLVFSKYTVCLISK